MSKIKIIVVGKYHNHSFYDAENAYLKRLLPRLKIEVKEVKEPNIPDTHASNISKIQKLESEKILSNLDSQSKVVILDQSGKELDSLSFAKYLSNFEEEITFIIGGSNGLSEEVKNKFANKISLSKLTFPHSLARLFLVEQIYRSFTIINNIKYHK